MMERTPGTPILNLSGFDSRQLHRWDQPGTIGGAIPA
jgi:hypothetical protein